MPTIKNQTYISLYNHSYQYVCDVSMLVVCACRLMVTIGYGPVMGWHQFMLLHRWDSWSVYNGWYIAK